MIRAPPDTLTKIRQTPGLDEQSSDNLDSRIQQQLARAHIALRDYKPFARP